ncbi:MAG TPA: hypothetical protein VMV21_16275 [Vicinamibacteria bacterium]|nr:hypothetical protein [Vicinamibacteria bacterium]
MPFDYYQRLSARNQRIYRESDGIVQVVLPRADLLFPFVALLREALAQDLRRDVEAAAGRLVLGMTEMLEVPLVQVQVLAVRPSLRYGELHGLYTNDPPRPPHIQVWMRTARHRRVVAFRTFLRTLLHEVGHHLDYTHLKLADSFHTEGFFKRESSLFYQLVPKPAVRPSGK